MITGTAQIPGGGSFADQNPNAQLSRSPYDQLDRWQLAALAERLGFKVRAGEYKDTLVQFLDMQEQIGKVKRNKALEQIAMMRHELAQKLAAHDGPDEQFGQIEAAPDADQARHAEKLELALLNRDELVAKAAEMGVKVDKNANRKQIFEQLIEALGW